MLKLGKFLCRIGWHNWGKAYPTASEVWGFGCGHHRQDCLRPECKYVRNHWPT